MVPRAVAVRTASAFFDNPVPGLQYRTIQQLRGKACMTERLLQIPIDELIPDPNQPRRHFLESELKRLAASIAARGILQPLRVMRDKERKCWRIVTGESRWRAARRLGLTTVPCVAGGRESARRKCWPTRSSKTIVGNDLRPLDLARAMAKLKKLKGCTSQDLAAELGISGPASRGRKPCSRCPPKCRRWWMMEGWPNRRLMKFPPQG